MMLTNRSRHSLYCYSCRVHNGVRMNHHIHNHCFLFKGVSYHASKHYWRRRLSDLRIEPLIASSSNLLFDFDRYAIKTWKAKSLKGTEWELHGKILLASFFFLVHIFFTLSFQIQLAFCKYFILIPIPAHVELKNLIQFLILTLWDTW